MNSAEPCKRYNLFNLKTISQSSEPLVASSRCLLLIASSLSQMWAAGETRDFPHLCPGLSRPVRGLPLVRVVSLPAPQLPAK